MKMLLHVFPYDSCAIISVDRENCTLTLFPNDIICSWLLPRGAGSTPINFNFRYI